MKTFIAIIVAGVVLFAFVILRAPAAPHGAAAPAVSNVSLEDGAQVAVIDVKGGYVPQDTAVKAGTPVILRFRTDGTFDCSSSIRIPALGISKTLPPTGQTDVALGVLAPGTLQGTCGMGMYRFSVTAAAS